jgi:hypothetical protein
MSFTEFPDCFVWTCDQCDLEVTFAPTDFSGCVAELKMRQWRFYNDDGEWNHTCGRCNYKNRQTSLLNQTIKGTFGKTG